MEDPKAQDDGGIKSRKLWFSVGSSIMLVLASLVVPVAVFPNVMYGLISVNAIYVGGNAATKWITKPSPDAPKPTKRRKKA